MPTTDHRKAAVLGKPIEHSLSPILHAAAYRALGNDWQFDKYEVDVEELASFLIGAGSDIAGYALTMPLKDEAFAIASTHDEYSELTRAANTLIPDAGGWKSFNTDVVGFINTLQETHVDVTRRPVVIGAGATARSAVAALSSLGAKHIDVVARREMAVAEIQAMFPKVAITAVPLGPKEVVGELVISTLPAGAADGIDLSSDVKLVYDVVYAPWPTRFALTAQERGSGVLGGLDLLVAQAVEQVILMTGCSDSERSRLAAAMRVAGESEQQKRSKAD